MKSKKHYGCYRDPEWNYPLKLILAQYAVKRWKSRLPSRSISETPLLDRIDGYDGISLRATGPDGSTIYLGIRKVYSQKLVAEITVFVKLSDGTMYRLPQHPETAVSQWTHVQGGWSAGGLKIQELEPQKRLRILFNGILTRVGDNKTQYVKFNLIWASATSVMRHPEDWSESLAAQTVALEVRKDESWSTMLNKYGRGSGSWLQFGAIQGRFQSFDKDGDIETSEYLRVRGVRERMWALGYRDVRRSVTITVAARDGTALQIRGFSYHKNFTQCISGFVRLPNFMVTSIKSTDIILTNFCKTAEDIPDTYSINLNTANGRTLKLVLRIKDGGEIYTGVPHQQKIIYRTVAAEINGEHGTGILELGYECLDGISPSDIKPGPVLQWVGESEAGSVGNCLSLDSRSAACVQHTGGKAASLALLSSVQTEEGYRVPPGFCITTKALNKHLDLNSKIKDAIYEIEACNKDYDENVFKEKCAKTVELFISTEIVEEINIDILAHLRDLRKKANIQKISTPLRFAVRSSGVGEDSEALSAAGQNETVLGCESNDDVLRGVQKCWASMFAFTSVYYRRQNGQACVCMGGVVVQALVTSRVAGVMFTSHPPHGDVSRILITANYGLGESVVSGTVEPDSIAISRDLDGKLSIHKIDLGSKTQRVITSNDGVTLENVPDSERTKPCLSETEILKLAKLAVSQELMWGAGRDIEWAFYGDDIFLLQARPITSLERWTEEELLHELDDPIMADDELTTFANTGESVVSGTVEPDSIAISRDLDGKLSIHKIDLGSKTQRVITSNDGVTLENVPDSERTKPCLSETEILKLAKLAVSQELMWGAGRDIEWAFYGDDIFLLQARPITSLERWTEEELLHELDDPIMADDELTTFANTGEVLPKPLSALSYDLVYTSLTKAIYSAMRTNGDGWDKSTFLTHNRCIIALYNSVYRRPPKEIDMSMRMLEMSIHGHKVADDAIHATALHRRTPRRFDKVTAISDMFKPLIASKWIMNKTIRDVNFLNLNVNMDDPFKFLNLIAGTEGDMTRFCSGHCSTSVASTFTQFIAMSVLLEGRMEFTTKECMEVGTLLSSGDVLSAEVPHALDRLAMSIEASGLMIEFRKQKPELAMVWLKKNIPQVHKEVCLFLDKHGHRAIMELDLKTKPWSLVPEELMKVLMHMNPTMKEQKQKSNDEVIASLTTPQKANTKKVLRWLLPLCHRTVRHREGTKAHIILAVHKLRIAVRHLAIMLYQAWLLPDVELVFYFRLHELREYLITRDPGLLKKAVQRQQYFAKWSKLNFSEINKGWPEPLKVEGPRIVSGDVRINATAVCQGEVVTRACVVKDLSEIGQLQQGDVLITHSTDIGWSPYFPLLSGIVTELGGLISHGINIFLQYNSTSDFLSFPKDYIFRNIYLRL